MNKEGVFMMENYLNKDYVATISDIDFNFEFNLVGLMREFQDLATRHSKEMGLSYFDLKQNDNAFWVLSKIKVKFLQDLPKWGDKFSILTYPLEPTNVRYGRNFKMSTKDGPTAIIGSSEWCILDLDTRKIRRTNTISSNPMNFDYISERLESESYTIIDDTQDDELLPLFEKVVRSTDLDINLHMNNVVYTKIVLDCFDAIFLQKNKIKEYELHFLKEAQEGAKIDIFKKQVEDGYVVYGKSKDKSFSYFKAKIKFERK